MTDTDFEDISEIFIGTVRSRISQMRLANDSGDIQELERLTHQLGGTAATYEYGEISELSFNICAALRKGASLSAIGGQLKTLLAALDSLLPQ